MLNKILKKSLILITCLLFLTLAFPIMAKEKSGKPSKTPPYLGKITFIHYAKDSKNSKPVWDEDNTRFKLLYGGIRWTETMTYEVNLTASGFNSQTQKEQAMTALSASLETWDSEISLNPNDLFEPIDTTSKDSVDYDSTNIVMWDALSPGIIAMNSFWFNIRTKEIVESDVVFNSYYTWGDCWGNEEVCFDDEVMDLENIATHEFGHNGLSDLYSPPTTALTMHGYSNYGETDKRDLGTGDINGIQALYGGL